VNVFTTTSYMYSVEAVQRLRPLHRLPIYANVCSR